MFDVSWAGMMTTSVVKVEIYRFIKPEDMLEILGQRTNDDSRTQVGASHNLLFSVLWKSLYPHFTSVTWNAGWYGTCFPASGKFQ